MAVLMVMVGSGNSIERSSLVFPCSLAKELWGWLV